MTDPALLHDLQISATHQLVEALVISENRMRQRLDMLAEVVFELDANKAVVFLSKAWLALMGSAPSQCLGQTFHGCIFQEDIAAFDAFLDLASHDSDARHTTLRFVKAPGVLLWMELSAARIETGHVGALRDITEQRRISDQLEYVAHFDVLTSLPNRALLSDRIRQAMSACQRHKQSMAVAFLDLDGFKSVNDSHGHAVGDKLLVVLATRMRLALRDEDSIARLGGDEFVAVLSGLTQMQQVIPVLTRLLQAASEPVMLDDLTLQVSASIGVTFYPQDNSDADQLIRNADQAMYLAKQSGKNRFVFFDVHTNSAANDHGKLVERLEQALVQGEFVLHYQPKVHIRSNKVLGMEALIRWAHPEKGLLLPDMFLHAIENHAMNARVGAWVIASALAQVDAWQHAGLELEVSVNVGAYQLLQTDFTAAVAGLLNQHPAVSADHLTFEILETSALSDTEKVADIIRACQALGVKFSLDDFGTGYSSLTYLRNLPAEYLKIDRSFVRDMLTDRDDLAIVKGVVALARAFKRKVIAEGVETPAHMDRLRRMGCDSAQGFGIASPMPAAEVADWTRAHNARHERGSGRSLANSRQVTLKML